MFDPISVAFGSIIGIIIFSFVTKLTRPLVEEKNIQTIPFTNFKTKTDFNQLITGRWYDNENRLRGKIVIQGRKIVGFDGAPYLPKHVLEALFTYGNVQEVVIKGSILHSNATHEKKDD